MSMARFWCDQGQRTQAHALRAAIPPLSVGGKARAR